MKTKTYAIALSVLAGVALSVPAHASDSPLPPASRYALPRAVAGGPLRLMYHRLENDGSVTFGYEVHDMDLYEDGWVYVDVNAHNPSYADAVDAADTFFTDDSTPDTYIGGTPGDVITSPLPAAMYQGNPTVQGLAEVATSGCRAEIVYARHRVAVDVEVVNFSLDTCGGWVGLHARRLANALMHRIP